MVSTDNSAADEEFQRAIQEIAAIMAETFLAKASREGRAIEPVDFIRAASGLLGSAWKMAKLAGPEHRAGYAEIVRNHAEAIERHGPAG